MNTYTLTELSTSIFMNERPLGSGVSHEDMIVLAAEVTGRSQENVQKIVGLPGSTIVVPCNSMRDGTAAVRIAPE